MPIDVLCERLQPYLQGQTVTQGITDRKVTVLAIKSGQSEIRCAGGRPTAPHESNLSTKEGRNVTSAPEE